ncbi:MAG: hypothetical protein J3R72DRAFT_476884 [Linnemannia gamsii]|nr:MAG: hypothetical protein J3R72DRAFT_476884 [Linnemannia gamsii]
MVVVVVAAVSSKNEFPVSTNFAATISIVATRAIVVVVVIVGACSGSTNRPSVTDPLLDRVCSRPTTKTTTAQERAQPAMPTSETTIDNRVSPKTTVAVVTSTSMPHKDDNSNGNRKDLFSANRLAPEIILIILSFLDYNDNPANLASILTLCKSWARLALELIYEQPVLTLKSLPNFVITLGLQDRLPNGQKPFWETNTHLETGRKTLGIEYRSMIKKPCRIVSAAVLSKDHLVGLWELQALLWTVPALSTSPVSMMTESPDAVAASSPCSSLPQSPLSPPSSPSPLVQSSASSPTLAVSTPTPTTTTPTAATTAVPLTTVALSSSFSPPPSPLRRTSSSSPSPSKAVVQRRKKRPLPPPGPVVIMLESTATFSEIMHDVLREVPGMKLRHLNYRLIPGLPLSGILRNHLPTLRELIISRSPARLDEYMAIARQLSGNNSNNNNNNNSGDDDTIDSSQQQQQQQQQQSHIHTLALDRCQGSGMTVLTELVRACGSHLRTLEYRQHSAVRPPVGGGGAGGAGEDLAQFPTDNTNGCNSQAIAQEVFARKMKKFPSLSTCEPGQACRQCGSFVDLDHGKASQETYVADDELEATIDGLSIAYTVTMPTTNDGTAAPEQQTQPPQQQQEGVSIPPVGMDPKTRMDLAMHTVSELCPRLTRLRLQNLTWLSDNGLSGFRHPSRHHRHHHYHHHQEQQQQQERHRGLREIELLDSYYASQVTIEGLLELCGPDLEVLVVDRRSCWRTRTKTRVSSENAAGAPISPSITASPLLAASGLGLKRGLCAGCVDKERLRRFRDKTMSTGDRIISGLLQQQPSKKSTSTNEATQQVTGDDNEEEEEEDGGHERGGQVVRRLCTLMLIEHWVSVQVFKEALCRWSRTLAVVSLRLYKCSNQELEDALMPRRKSASPVTGTAAETAPETTTASALERLELSLPWIASSETEEQLSGLVDKVFEAHTSLSRVEINRRSWRRKASMTTAATTLLSTSA